MKGYVGRSPLADRYMPYSYGGVSEEDGLDVDQDGSISSGRRANESDRASLDPSSHMDIATLRAKLKTNKRWSILDKLEKRHYCRVRSCKDCMRIMNCKCLLATAMLGIFVLCALSFTRAVFSSSNRDSANYDYIVVGGGSAGAVLTTRLVGAGANVLLLEAGSGTQFALGGTDHFAAQLTRYLYLDCVPTLGSPVHTHSFDIPLLWPLAAHLAAGAELRGERGLGGGAVYGSMLYLRATAADVACWAIKGLTWGRLLEKYKQMERFEPEGSAPVASFHGSDGPITTAAPEVTDTLAPLFVSAVQGAGLGAKQSADFNDPSATRIGAGYFHFNIFGGRRDSAAQSLLAPLMREARSNLVVETKATVRRVLLEPLPPSPAGAGPREAVWRAVGVEYVRGGKVHSAYLRTNSLPLGTASAASRGVLLACGSVGTPQLLLASGVGPTATLAAAGIEQRVRSDEVGKGLQSQPTVAVVAEIAGSIFQSGGPAIATEWIVYIDALATAVASAGGEKISYGALGSPGFSAGAFLASPFSYSGEPDVQLTLYPSFMDTRAPRSSIDAASSSSSGGLLLVTVTLLSAESTQEVRLNSTAPLDGSALLEPSSFSSTLSSGDIDRLCWGVQAARRVLAADPLRQLVAIELAPGASADSQQLRDWVLRTAYAGPQRAGSTRMGSDEDSVVDDQMQVRGVRDLRAVGPSVLPRTVSASDGTATHVALAALAADQILG